MKISAIAISFGILINSSLFQSEPGSVSLEKQAIAAVQQKLAFELDAELPKSPFGEWFKRLVGPRAGVIWQLTECGGPISVPNGAEQDLPACAQANAVLANGSKVIVSISVGTFKKGLKGQPSFFRAVIDYHEELNQVRRLHELQEILRTPESLPMRLLSNTPDMLPNILKNLSAVELISYQADLSRLIPDANPVQAGFEEVNAPPPPQTEARAPQKVEESVLLGNAMTRALPVYPVSARFMNAYGKVEVEVTVSEKGVVTEAKAISGHPALRNAATEAARKWVFKPSTLHGAPVEVLSILTFMFTPR